MRTACLYRSSPRTAVVFLFVCLGTASGAEAAVIRVPQDYSSIQAAINAAQNGDTVLLARGTYAGGLVISGKTITLASNFINTRDPNDVNQTIIDGGSPILAIQSSVGAATTVQGLTFRNGSYQLKNYARRLNILNNHFINGGGDQVSFEGAGGLVRDCFFDNAGDDGIDVDNASDPTIENNTIQSSGNDGIEIRLQGYTGSMLNVVIRNNFISGAREDGIQLIDYAGLSSRAFRIERNVIVNNGMAGLGCMAGGKSAEDFAGAPLVEEVQVINNTFYGNPHGLTGGDNMLVMNNIFANSAQIGVKRVAASSLVTYNDFWSNGTNYTGSNVNTGTTLLQDPRLDASYGLEAGSPCIDRGAASIVWNGKTVTAPPYSGSAPDLGAREGSSGTPLPTVTITATDANAAEAGQDPGRFTLSRTGAVTEALTVYYAVGGTATPGSDYTALSGSVTIAAGASSAVRTVTPLDDSQAEASETVVATLSGRSYYNVGSPSSATVTIADNEAALPIVTITVSDGTAAEAGPDPGRFRVSRTGATGASLTVSYTIAGDATNGVDYQTIGTTVTIPAGSAAATVTITPIDDSVADDEEVVLTLAARSSYVVGTPQSASLTITDNDTAQARSFQDGLWPSSSYAGTRDTYLSQPYPTSEFGTAPTVRADGDAGSGMDLSGLLKWDLSSIPPGSVIRTVAITLDITSTSSQTYQIYEMKRPWVETEANWNVYAIGSSWAVAGAQGSQDRGSTALGTVTATALGSYTLTLNSSGVALVQSWVNTPSTNKGIIIANPTNVDRLVLSSRNVTTAAQRPKLTVTY